MSSSFSTNLYNAINFYSSDIYYYYGEINYRIPRYNVYVKDLHNNFCYRNKSNKFYLRSPSSDIMEVRIQPDITWKENILRIRILFYLTIYQRYRRKSK